jgi:small subunit ribosomal protein S20
MAEAKEAAPKKAEGKQPKKAQGRSSAQKRALQSEKRRLANRSYRAKVATAIRGYKDALEQKKSADETKQKLNLIFSLMDRGVKKGIYKPGKAARTKSRLSVHRVA